MRERLILASSVLMLVACGGSGAPAKSPETKPEAGAAEPAPVLEDAPVQVENDAPPPPEAVKAPLPCPGKEAKYWDTGAIKSEVVSEDCTINGRSFKAGTLIEFDENGALVE